MSRFLSSILPESVKDLPVFKVIPKIVQALEKEKKALVQAPPGAGKTTLVPLALLDQPWMKDKKIVMLEPRRLAARACAAHMASLLGEKPGQTVGFQVRMERCIGPLTRIEIITEGILTRKIQSDPGLEKIGVLIFDEFHERHIHGDLGLALALESSGVFNPELRILVMSATMDTRELSSIMDNAPVILSQGRTWPVTTHYLDPSSGTLSRHNQGFFTNKGREIVPACAKAVVRALERDQGDILVFLPGAAQIRDLETRLSQTLGSRPDIKIYPLFGNLRPDRQAAAIAPSLPGQQKIVLATPIAETSLTIQGVRVVVDSGLANLPRFSPGRGMTRLETLPVSRASADQRRGRAGRTAPGVCYRLWSEHVHQGLVPFNRPEMLCADLASLALELAQWGVKDPRDLKWLDPVPENGFESARGLLKRLGALDDGARITAHGQRLLTAGIHPRLAHMVVKAMGFGQGFMACCLAALVEARDFMGTGQGGTDPDLGLRLEILQQMAKKGRSAPGSSVHMGRAQSVLKQARRLADRFKITSRSMDIPMAGRVLAFAWPERVARKRGADSLAYLMASGSGAYFSFANSLSNETFIVAVHLDGNPKSARIFLGAAFREKDLETDFSVQTRARVVWDKKSRSVRAFTQKEYGKILLGKIPLADPDPQAVTAALVQGISEAGIGILPWTKDVVKFRDRVTLLRGLKDLDPAFEALPDLSDDGLHASLDLWLAPFLDRISSLNGLGAKTLETALKSRISWDQQQMVKVQAPTHVTVPSGSRIPIQYRDENGPLKNPVLAVRLQEMFGLMQTPAIARGKLPLTLYLLSPASRPVQITRDIENFWKQTYTEVKKDLMGRYPKHYWPDDPGSAQPTARAKPRH